MNFEYKEKYLKYKKKYTELKSNLKGGTLVNRCDRQTINTFTDVVSFYLISKLSEYFTNRILYPIIAPPAYNVNFMSNPVDISASQLINSISFNHYSKRLPPPPIGNNVLQIYQPQDLAINPNQLILNLRTEPPRYSDVKFFDRGGIDAQVLVEPNVFLDLTSSIIGKNFNLTCDESVVENFLLDITTNSHKKIVVIDFQNIIKIIEDNELGIGGNRIACGTVFTKKIFAKKINNMLHTYLLNGDYVFIIFKKSMDYDYKFLEQIFKEPYNLSSLLYDSSRLQIIGVELGTIFKPGERTDLAGRTFDKNYLGIYNKPVTSSNDDFVFWIVIVSICNIINSRIKNNPGTTSFNFTTNLIVFTNDTQGLDDNCNRYYDNITNVFKSENCGRAGPSNIPEKNLFDINLGVDLPFVLNGYQIYTNSLRFTNSAINIDGRMQVSANNFYYVNNYLLNNYINFIHNLFGNTPIKLNNDPRYLIGDERTPNNIFNASQAPSNYRYDQFANNIERKKVNAKAFYSLTNKFQTNNICLSSLRTDVVNFIINRLPIRTFGTDLRGKSTYIENTLINLSKDIIDFNNLMVHPGLYFYAQIKNIQSIVFGRSNGSKSKDEIVHMSDEFSNFNIRYNNLLARSQFLNDQLIEVRAELNECMRKFTECDKYAGNCKTERNSLRVQIGDIQTRHNTLQEQLILITNERDKLKNAQEGISGKRGRIDEADNNIEE